MRNPSQKANKEYTKLFNKVKGLYLTEKKTGGYIELINAYLNESETLNLIKDMIVVNDSRKKLVDFDFNLHKENQSYDQYKEYQLVSDIIFTINMYLQERVEILATYK